ncbi:Vfa1 domain-containing protein [Phanerochaete sordida]|uniref:Vfa1 domain-containing protein n=1 Tax=Phanerochaete sordida TaxID=48140 RepID=A0A9P3FYN2_9APHY|nr:Vfa1 domain-containing protein [Phanerochaete sordida]
MSFTNLYYKRTAGTPRACYVCYKPTTTVLATVNTVDFVYCCDGHLADPGFAAKVSNSGEGTVAGTQKAGLSPEEIAKVKAEWEERQARKKEKEKSKDADKDQEKEKEKKASDKTQEDKEGKLAKDRQSATPPSSSPRPDTPQATHERYTLHRDVFAMRQAEHRRRKQTAQANALAPRLPQAPRAPLP